MMVKKNRQGPNFGSRDKIPIMDNLSTEIDLMLSNKSYYLLDINWENELQDLVQPNPQVIDYELQNGDGEQLNLVVL